MKESSSVKTVNAPVERVYSTLSNLENLRPLLDKAQNDEKLKEKIRESGQADALDALANIQLTSDSVSVPAAMIGSVSLTIVEREENKCIKFVTDKSPIKGTLWIQVLPLTDTTSKMKLTIDADIPFMLKAMVGSKLKNGIEQLASGLAMIKY